jgi:hypothetical protein
MGDDRELNNLEALLDLLGKAGEGKERVTIEIMIEAAGRRSFGPLLLVPGLIALSPLSGIPGMPTTVGIMVLVLAGQLLLGRRHFWLPKWLLKRSVSKAKFERALRFLSPLARSIDRMVRPRLRRLTQDGAIYFISVMAILVALTLPPLEFVPFAATTAGAALTAFGLALIAHDGVLVVIAALFYAASLMLVAKSIL